MLSYKDLEIYKLSHTLAVEVHKMTLKELPKKNREQFESFLSGYEELGAKIMKFTQAVERGHLVPKS